MRNTLPRLIPMPRAVAMLVVALTGLAACQQPAPPPQPRALTIYPQQQQTQAQQDRDKSDCHNAASAAATSSDSWAQIFAACMSGRGYGVE